MPAPTVEESYRVCEGLVKNHYENFPVGSLLIPGEQRRHVWAVYAFARTADDFSDEGRHPKETAEDLKRRLDELDGWELNLVKCSRGEAENPIFIALAQTIKELNLPIQLLKDLLTAYRMDVRQKRYRNFDEVLYYCRHSANPVGRLVLWISGYRNETLNLYSDKICTALQLANFWQDVSIDLAKDRIYIPEDEMKKFGVTEGDLHAKICNRAFRLLLKYCCDFTKGLFNEGLPLCREVGKDLRMEMRLTWLGGTTILKKLARNDYDVFRKRPKIDTADKLLLLARALSPLTLKPVL